MPILLICEGGPSGPIYRWGNWVSRRVKYLTGLSHFSALCFTALHRHCVGFLSLLLRVLQIDVLWQPRMERVDQHHFSNSIFSLCISVSHFHNSHNNSNFFSIIIHVLVICKSVIFDVTVIFVSRCHKPCPNETAHLTDKRCVCYARSTDPPFLLPLLRALYFLGHSKLKLGQLITLQWPLSVQLKERVTCFSL